MTKWVNVFRSSWEVVSLIMFPAWRQTSPKESGSLRHLYSHLSSSYSSIKAHPKVAFPGKPSEEGFVVLSNLATSSYPAGCASREGGLSPCHLLNLL